MSAVVSAFSTARTQFRGSLYSASALDGQTRSHLQVGSVNLSINVTCQVLEGRTGHKIVHVLLKVHAILSTIRMCQSAGIFS